MDTHLLLLFLGVDLLLVCTPGPDWLYIVARGLAQGRRIGLIAVAGICSGYLLYTALVASGLAAALRAVPAALPTLRYAGAAYLVFLAFRTLMALRRGRGGGEPAATTPQQSARVVLRQSLLTALLNPKAMLLFLSLFPQFISPGAALPVGAQMTTLGTLHILNCALVYGLVALAAGRAHGALTTSAGSARRLSAISAALLLVVAAFTLSLQ